MIYDALNASAVSVPPCLCPAAQDASAAAVCRGDILGNMSPTHHQRAGIFQFGMRVRMLCTYVLRRDCEGGKDALPLFAHLPGCHLGYCSVLLASWLTSTATALAHDLSGESAGCWNMFKHLVRAGKCHLSIMMTQPPPIDDHADHIHLTGLKTVITHQTYRHRKKSGSFVWNMMSHKELNFTRVPSGWNGG